MIALPIAKTDSKIDIAPSKIIAVGLNYQDYIMERTTRSVAIPKEPILFAKTLNTLIGPEEPIILPAIVKDYPIDGIPRTDIEGELAIIISKRGKHIPKDKVFEYVFGYTCYNDISQRNIQNADVSGWFRGKSFDTFGPIGPVVVRHKDIGDPQKLRINSRVNGTLKQSGNTQDMIFSIVELISFISRNFTLEEGDIIATGTPAGVFPIRAGDLVEVEIKGIGILRNPVIAEKVEKTK